MTRRINQVLGTNLGPWDLDGLPDLDIAIILEGLKLKAEMTEEGLI